MNLEKAFLRTKIVLIEKTVIKADCRSLMQERNDKRNKEI